MFSPIIKIALHIIERGTIKLLCYVVISEVKMSCTGKLKNNEIAGKANSKFTREYEQSPKTTILP